MSSTPTARRTSARLWILVSMVALALRMVLVPLGAKYGWRHDHTTFAGWGLHAADEGVLALYQRPSVPRHFADWDGERWVWHRQNIILCNYPPMSAYLFWCSGKAFSAISDDRLVNTAAARTVFGAWSILSDFLLAWGCASLVGLYRPGRARWWTYVIVLFIPPFWWDSVVWGQTDTVLLAPAVWMVRAMAGGRWVWAGLLYGLMAGLKPQAMLFVPVWGLAVVITRPFWRPLLALSIGAGLLLLISLPFTVYSGWAWFQHSYVHNVQHTWPLTTHPAAFNLWYLDLLICDQSDSTATWAGITKDTWGWGFLLLALGAGFVWMAVRWQRRRPGLLLWTALVLLFSVMLPTRVHERYLVLVLPFLLLSAFLWPRLWPGFLMLLVVCALQLSWPAWLRPRPGSWEKVRAGILKPYQAGDDPASPRSGRELRRLRRTLREAREDYLQSRARIAPYEWFGTVLALLATAAVTWGALCVSPARASVMRAPRGPPPETAPPPAAR